MTTDACSLEEVLAQAMRADGNVSDDVKHRLRSASLLDICKLMQNFLCDTSHVQPSMRLLTLAAIGRPTLAATDAFLICNFLAEKLSRSDLQATALGSIALVATDFVERGGRGSDLFHILCEPFVKNVKVQQLPLNNRKQCFCILEFLFTEDTVLHCDPGTLSFLLDSMDGESDPELVLQSFHLHCVVAAHAAGTALVPVLSEFFESISSYFPVVFSQPPGCHVSKSDLKCELRKCLSSQIYCEMSIPFLLGKLASPSIAVKEDVLDTLESCFQACSVESLSPFFQTVVLHIRNEVIKLSSFSHGTPNRTLSKCVSMCCAILRLVSSSCGMKDQSSLLELFGPVVEGFLSCAESGTETCSAYATMVFNIVVGSWDACLQISSYLFSVLSLSLRESSSLSHVFILFAALCSGMLDGLEKYNSEEHVCGMRNQIMRATPVVVEAVTHFVEKWAGCAATPEETFEVLCGCEFIVSVLKLSTVLPQWIAEASASSSLTALLRIALRGGSDVTQKVCSLVREYGALNGVVLYDVLRDFLKLTDVDAEGGIRVLTALSSASSSTTMLILEEGVLGTTEEAGSPWLSTISAIQKADFVYSILQVSAELLSEADRHRLIEIFSKKNIPEYFHCACLVAAHADCQYCLRILEERSAIPIFTIATIVASRCDLQAAPSWDEALPLLSNLCTKGEKEATWRAVGMEGLCGLVRNSLVTLDLSGVINDTPALCIFAKAAVLWGRLLCCETAEKAHRQNDNFLPFIQHLLSTSAKDSNTMEIVFSYVPFSARQMEARPSLLGLCLEAALTHSIKNDTVLWQIIQCLVRGETSECVQASQPLLAAMISNLTPTEDACRCATIREVLLSVCKKCQPDSTLCMCILKNRMSLEAVFTGISDTSVVTRCDSVELLTSLSYGAAEALGSQGTNDEKINITRIRDEVLDLTKYTLGDHKRRVRQRAARCRHEWFKVK